MIIMKDINIPIVFATDENYVLPTAVAIKSLVAHFSKKQLLFVILVKGILSDHSIELLNQSIKSNEINISIEYIYINEELFGHLKTHIEHISMATYFRLLLPNLLDNYDRCLYLDGDICILEDISDLLYTHLSAHEYVAGVKAYGIITSRLIGTKRLKILKIDNLNHYINAGVLIMNLKALRQSGVANTWLSLAQNDYPLQDQDVINIACFDHIKILSPKYNAMPVIYRKSLNSLKQVYSHQEILEARQHPVIIHYADKYKPWQYYDIDHAKEWYKYYHLLTNQDLLKLKKLGLKRFIDTQKGRINYIFKKVIKK